MMYRLRFGIKGKEAIGDTRHKGNEVSKAQSSTEYEASRQ